MAGGRGLGTPVPGYSPGDPGDLGPSSCPPWPPDLIFERAEAGASRVRERGPRARGAGAHDQSNGGHGLGAGTLSHRSTWRPATTPSGSMRSKVSHSGSRLKPWLVED